MLVKLFMLKTIAQVCKKTISQFVRVYFSLKIHEIAKGITMSYCSRSINFCNSTEVMIHLIHSRFEPTQHLHFEFRNVVFDFEIMFKTEQFRIGGKLRNIVDAFLFSAISLNLQLLSNYLFQK